MQPPPRGCVLKHQHAFLALPYYNAAASARLCVETFITNKPVIFIIAAASARLCVETIALSHITILLRRSRLRAAVC